MINRLISDLQKGLALLSPLSYCAGFVKKAHRNGQDFWIDQEQNLVNTNSRHDFESFFLADELIVEKDFSETYKLKLAVKIKSFDELVEIKRLLQNKGATLISIILDSDQVSRQYFFLPKEKIDAKFEYYLITFSKQL